MRWGCWSTLRVGRINRVRPIHGRRGGMARMVVLVVLVILWRFPGVMRMPERCQVVRLLLRRTRWRVGLLDRWKRRTSLSRWWWWRRMARVMLLVRLRRRLLLLLLRGMGGRGVLWLLLLRMLLLDRRRRWLRMGCRVVVLRLVWVVRWRRTMVTMRRLGVWRTRSDRFHDERKMQPCGQGCGLWDYLSKRRSGGAGRPGSR